MDSRLGRSNIQSGISKVQHLSNSKANISRFNNRPILLGVEAEGRLKYLSLSITPVKPCLSLLPVKLTLINSAKPGSINRSLVIRFMNLGLNRLTLSRFSQPIKLPVVVDILITKSLLLDSTLRELSQVSANMLPMHHITRLDLNLPEVNMTITKE
jgi:hypothetical protein